MGKVGSLDNESGEKGKVFILLPHEYNDFSKMYLLFTGMKNNINIKIIIRFRKSVGYCFINGRNEFY